MKIERILRGPEDKPLTVPMGNRAYIFKPEYEGGPMVCDVKDEDHANVFLSIPEGYREADDDADTPDPALTTADATRTAPVNALILDTSGQAPGGSTNETSMIDAFVTERALDDMDIDQIREVFKSELGRTPNARAARETLKAQIEANREQAAQNQRAAEADTTVTPTDTTRSAAARAAEREADEGDEESDQDADDSADQDQGKGE